MNLSERRLKVLIISLVTMTIMIKMIMIMIYSLRDSIPPHKSSINIITFNEINDLPQMPRPRIPVRLARASRCLYNSLQTFCNGGLVGNIRRINPSRHDLQIFSIGLYGSIQA